MNWKWTNSVPDKSKKKLLTPCLSIKMIPLSKTNCSLTNLTIPFSQSGAELSTAVWTLTSANIHIHWYKSTLPASLDLTQSLNESLWYLICEPDYALFSQFFIIQMLTHLSLRFTLNNKFTSLCCLNKPIILTVFYS